MRIAFIILIGIHGIIHLFGFLKAFDLAEFNAISQPISKTFGVVWLLTFVLFAIATALLIAQPKYWWVAGFAAVLLSQFLIINYWSDAKFGTVMNVVILLSIILAYSAFSFKKNIGDETAAMLESSSVSNNTVLSEQLISDLPPVIQKWLMNSGAVGKEVVHSVYIQQDLQMLMKPEQKDWNNAKAEQYFTTEPPAFNWSVGLKMNPLIEVVGRDKFENGQGEMTIKMFSLFSVADAKNSEKVNQATLQRYLAEMVWFPSSAISPHIVWEQINDTSAKATMEFKGTKGSGVFEFDANGDFVKFVAMRYKDVQDSEPTEWTVTAIKTELRNGVRIPVELKADWKLESGIWTWLKLEITDIQYNIRKNKSGAQEH